MGFPKRGAWREKVSKWKKRREQEKADYQAEYETVYAREREKYIKQKARLDAIRKAKGRPSKRWKQIGKGLDSVLGEMQDDSPRRSRKKKKRKSRGISQPDNMFGL